MIPDRCSGTNLASAAADEMWPRQRSWRVERSAAGEHFEDGAGLADFLVGDHADAAILAPFGGAGDGERGVVTHGTLGAVGSDEGPRRGAAAAHVVIQGLRAELAGGEEDVAGMRLRRGLAGAAVEGGPPRR